MARLASPVVSPLYLTTSFGSDIVIEYDMRFSGYVIHGIFNTFIKLDEIKTFSYLRVKP